MPFRWDSGLRNLPRAEAAKTRAWAVGAGLWGAGALVIAPVAHGVYASETALLAYEDGQLQATPREYWTQEDVYRALDRRLAKALAEGRGDTATALAHGAPEPCLSEPDLAFNAASAALAGGWAEASATRRIGGTRGTRGTGEGAHGLGPASTAPGRPRSLMPP